MLLTIIAFVAVLGILVFVHELGHFVVAKKSNMIVEEFGIGFPPRIFSFKKGETRYSINLFPLGGFVKIEGEDGEKSDDPRSFVNRSAWQRFLTLIAGVTMNFLLAVFLFSLIAGLGFPEEITEDNQARAVDQRVMLLEIAENSPASNSGLSLGDEIIKFAGQDITTIKELQGLAKLKAGQEVTALVKRGSDVVAVSLTPRVAPPENEGPLGVALAQVGRVKYLPHQALWQGVTRTYDMTILIGDALGGMLSDLVTKGEVSQDISGPVGVAVFSGKVARLGILALLNFTAILSINLGILNILPIPALDGGRILFLVVEKIRGRKGARVEQISNTIGFVLLIALLAVVSVKDVVKFDVLSRLKDLI